MTYSECYQFVPKSFYGRCSSVLTNVPPSTVNNDNPLAQEKSKASTSVSAVVEQPQPVSSSTVQLNTRAPMTQDKAKVDNRPSIKISLKRDNVNVWAPAIPPATANNGTNCQESGVEQRPPGASSSTKAPPTTTNNSSAASVAENVSLFLNGIRATFRHDNVYVSSSARQKKSGSNLESNDDEQT